MHTYGATPFQVYLILIQYHPATALERNQYPLANAMKVVGNGNSFRVLFRGIAKPLGKTDICAQFAKGCQFPQEVIQLC